MQVLLPHIDIKGERKIRDFLTTKACIKWLEEIGRGMMWDEEMQGIEAEVEDNRLDAEGSL